MSPDYYKELFNVPVKYNGFVGTTTDKSKDGEELLSKDLMKNTDIGSVSFITNTSEHFKQTMGSIDSVVVVLIVSAAALAFVVMYNLTNINISERIRELATIKVLGFYDSEVAAYVYRENVVLSIIGTILGLFLGIGLHRYVVVTAEIDMVMFIRTIKAIDFIYSAILTIVFSGLVNIVMYRRLKKIDMVESLKSAE
ncbi:FtsX-like permease family protein [compost metagenome]